MSKAGGARASGRRAPQRTVGLLLCAALGSLAACTGDPTPTVPSEISPTDSPTAVALPQMVDLGTYSGLRFVSAVSERYLVVATEDGAGVEVTRRSDGATLLEHRNSDASYETTFADLAGDVLVVSDEDVHNAGEKQPAMSFIYDLKKGTEAALSDVDGALPASEAGAQAVVTDDGRYYYSSLGATTPRQTCLSLLDLPTMRPSVLGCSARADDWYGYYVVSSGDGASWLDWHDLADGASGCRRDWQADASVAVPIIGPPDCRALVAVRLGPWTSYASSADMLPVVALAATDGDQTVQLGQEDGVTLTTCGGYAYWRLSHYQDRVIHIFRWRPGDPAPTEVMALADPVDQPGFRQITLRGCSDNLMNLLVFQTSPDGSDHTQVVAVPS